MSTLTAKPFPASVIPRPQRFARGEMGPKDETGSPLFVIHNAPTPVPKPSEIQGSFHNDVAWLLHGGAIPTPREDRVHKRHPIAGLNSCDTKTAFAHPSAEEAGERAFCRNSLCFQKHHRLQDPARGKA